jgi:hypothetical protein
MFQPPACLRDDLVARIGNVEAKTDPIKLRLKNDLGEKHEIIVEELMIAEDFFLILWDEPAERSEADLAYAVMRLKERRRERAALGKLPALPS